MNDFPHLRTLAEQALTMKCTCDAMWGHKSECAFRDAIETFHESLFPTTLLALLDKGEQLRTLAEAVNAVRFGYCGDVGNTVSGWPAVETALAALSQGETGRT